MPDALRSHTFRPVRPVAAALVAGVLLAACGDPPAPVVPAPPAATAAAAPGGSGVDWRACQLPGVTLPVPGKLFVIDGGLPTPDAEAGRESIRRVEIAVPGPVALLLTAPDATVWLVRASPETEVRAIFAAGEQPQRISGQGLGPVQRAASQAMGEDCGRYWMQGGAGPQLAEVAQEVFGRRHDAIYTMRVGVVVIGGPESSLPDNLDPAR